MKKITTLVLLFNLILIAKLFAQSQPNYENAICSSQKIESNLQAGKTYNVSVTFENIGKKTWTKGDYWIVYTDPRMSPMTNNVWSIDEIKIKRNVKPGKSYIFKFKVTAPHEPGIYFFSWMMCGINGSFGAGSEIKQILVSQ
jgi:hypothetical protein